MTINFGKPQSTNPNSTHTPNFMERNSNRDSKGHLEMSSGQITSDKFGNTINTNLESTKIISKEHEIVEDYGQ